MRPCSGERGRHGTKSCSGPRTRSGASPEVRARPSISSIALAGVWSPPERLHCSLGGTVHWQVPATALGVEEAARYVVDPRPGVRHAAVAALVNAGNHGQLAAASLRSALADEDARVRILAARAAAGLGLGQELRDELERTGADPVWTVRWYAARALLAVDVDMACKLLESAAPRPGSAAVETWLGCARAVRAPTVELCRRVDILVGAQ
jgi:HEAT repeat protein